MGEIRLPCPECGHGERDRAMSLNTETGVYYCHRCHRGGKKEMSGRMRPVFRSRVDNTHRREMIEQIWAQCLPLDSGIRTRTHRRYLLSRGLSRIVEDPPQDLRAHRRLDFWEDGRCSASFPALVVPLRDLNGDIRALHRTYLDPSGDGKAPVDAPKRIISAQAPGGIAGAAMQLYAPEEGRLGVAEALESSLSLSLLRNIPVWSGYCAGNLESVDLPDGLRVVEIGVDIDPSGVGEIAAKRLAARLAARPDPPEIYLVRPDGRAPRDLNDEIRPRA